MAKDHRITIAGLEQVDGGRRSKNGRLMWELATGNYAEYKAAREQQTKTA